MGAAVGGRAGLVFAFGVALVMNLVSLWKSDTMVLKMFKAQEVDETAAPELFRSCASSPRGPNCRCRASTL